MAEFKAIFVQPTFTALKGYNPDGLHEWLSEVQETESEKRVIAHAVKKFPWLKPCFDYTGTHRAVNALRAENPAYDYRNRTFGFRDYIWHLDNPEQGSRLRMFRTAQPAIFASGTFVYDYPIELTNKHFEKRLIEIYGLDWFEQSIGLANRTPGIYGFTIDRFIKDVVNLEIVPGEPGVIADGPTETTLHTSSIIPDKNLNLQSVIYRVQYTPN